MREQTIRQREKLNPPLIAKEVNMDSLHIVKFSAIGIALVLFVAWILKMVWPWMATLFR